MELRAGGSISLPWARTRAGLEAATTITSSQHMLSEYHCIFVCCDGRVGGLLKCSLYFCAVTGHWSSCVRPLLATRVSTRAKLSAASAPLSAALGQESPRSASLGAEGEHTITASQNSACLVRIAVVTPASCQGYSGDLQTDQVYSIICILLKRNDLLPSHSIAVA